MTNPNNAGELILGLTQLSGEALVFMPWRAAVGGEAILQMRGRPLRRSTTPRGDIHKGGKLRNSCYAIKHQHI